MVQIIGEMRCEKFAAASVSTVMHRPVLRSNFKRHFDVLAILDGRVKWQRKSAVSATYIERRLVKIFILVNCCIEMWKGTATGSEAQPSLDIC
jgi:hypothetical protein